MSDAIEDVAWRSDPDIVRQFLTIRPRYKELCNEVAYILRKRVKRAEIAFAAVPARAKTLTSFLQKIERKSYEKPFDEVTPSIPIRNVTSGRRWSFRRYTTCR